MDDSDSKQLDAVFAGVVRTLGDSVVGVYQYGSAVMGNLGPFSDLDLLVVVDRPTSSEQRRRLLDEILPVSGTPGRRRAGRPVEVTVVLQGTVKPWRPHQEREFQYGEWLREDYEAGLVPKPETDDDLAPLLATVLTASIPLVGQPARELIDPIPHHHLVASMRTAIPLLVAELDTDTTNVLLTLSRMWHTKESGLITTKDEAASWALNRTPVDLRPPLEHARAVYTGQEHASFNQMAATVRATADHMSATVLD